MGVCVDAETVVIVVTATDSPTITPRTRDPHRPTVGFPNSAPFIPLLRGPGRRSPRYPALHNENLRVLGTRAGSPLSRDPVLRPTRVHSLHDLVGHDERPRVASLPRGVDAERPAVRGPRVPERALAEAHVARAIEAREDPPEARHGIVERNVLGDDSDDLRGRGEAALEEAREHLGPRVGAAGRDAGLHGDDQERVLEEARAEDA